MDANEVKACLKKARDAIREKDFKGALQQSKAVLSADKDNYNALVFTGIAAEGLNQPEQALKAFKKAAEKEPKQLLAWQGLASFRDKNPNVIGTDEAITIYQKLTALTTSDTKKQITFSSKLVDLYLKSQNKIQAIEILQHILEVQKEQPDRTESLQLMITLLSESSSNLSQSKLSLYQSALSEILQYTSWLNKGDINSFIEMQLCLTAKMSADTLKTSCETFKEKFPDAPSPKEFLLRSQLEANIGNATVSIATCEQISNLVDQLQLIRPESAMIPVGQGFLAFQKKDFVQALSLLKDCSSDNLSGLYYLTLTYLGLHKYTLCLETAKKGMVALSSPGRVKCTPMANIDPWFKLAMAEAYRQMNTIEARENALSILDEVSDELPIERLLIKAYVHLDHGNISEAETCANQLSQDSLQGQTLKASILHARKEYSSALQILRKVIQEEPYDFKTTLKLGQTLWELRESQTMENVKQECFNLLLKAAKLDSLHYASFLYLGYFYREIQKDNVKARKCFQKAYDLNPASAEAGSALVDLLMEQGEWSQCSVILQQATSQAAAGHAKWAWLRQGLYQLKQNDYTAATKSLQSALRGDPNDNHVWECLADAYLERGSHNAALKAFTKASELDPNSVYCLYKIANIKHILGELSEAVKEYKKILEKSPDYVPVLKGVSESLIQLGRTNLDNCLDELAKDCFQEAIIYLTRAAAQRPDLSCLWKLLGDACTFIYPTAIESFSVPVKLFKKTSCVHEVKEISKIELLEVGASCYSQALKIFSESSSLWHDLGVNLYYQSQVTLSNRGDLAGEVRLLDRAAKAVKRAVNLDPKGWQHWNLLGVIAFCSACENPALAQHSFIKSVECEANNAVAWTNLGAFYLSKSNVELAFNAFSKAQNIDPTYFACWIGQAMIAETVGHQEAMDLFRHSSELGFHLESALGYGQWVLKVLGDPAERKTESYHYSIQQMAALPAASDALIRYTRRIKTDPVAYNMQGLLFEHQNLLDSSILAFQKAVILLEKEDSGNVLNDVRINLARVLSKQGKFDQSVAVYEQCSLGTDVHNTCQYGLTLFKSGRTQEAFKVFGEVLSLVSGQPLESEVYAALGMVAYKAGDTSQAKSLLFKGFQTSQPSAHGLLALCALGLLHKDMKLSTAVLEELFKREDKEEVLKDVHLLKVYQTFLEDHVEEGLIELKQLCETSKENSALWYLLGGCFLKLLPNLNSQELKESILQLLCLSHGGTTQDGKGNLVQTLCQLLAGFHHRLHSDRNVLKAAQKAFHANPGCRSTLSALTAAVHAEALVTNDSKSQNLLKIVKDFLNILLQDNKIAPELKTWSLQMLVINSIELGDVDMAESYLKTLQQARKASQGEDQFQKSIKSYLARQIVPMDEIDPLQVAIDCELSCQLKDYPTGIDLLERLIKQTEAKNSCHIARIHNLKERQAYLAYCGLKGQPDCVILKKQFDDGFESLKDSSIVIVMAAFRALALNDKRKAKYLFATALDKVHGDKEIGYCSSVARQWMLELSWNTNKEQDQKLIQNLLEDAKSTGDNKTLERFRFLSARK